MRRIAVTAALLAVTCLPVASAQAGGTVAFSSTACESMEDYERRKPPRDPMHPFPPPDDGSVCPAAIWLVADDGSQLRRITGDGARDSERVTDYQPTWSPDGSRLAFYRESFDTETEEFRGGLYTVGADGSDPRRLEPTFGGEPIGAHSPAWSPDGRRIVFVSRPPVANPWAPEDAELYSMAPDGSDVVQLTESPESEHSPSFAPDGRILFSRLRHFGGPPFVDQEEQRQATAGQRPGLYTIALDGSDERRSPRAGSSLASGRCSPGTGAA